MWSAVACVALACGAAIGAQNPTSAQGGGQTPSARCRISGRLTSGTAPLPGASIVVSLDNSPRAITSSDVDGTYVVQLSPGATYRLAADLAGFSTIERTIDLTAPACDQTIDLQLVLQPRRPAGQTPSSGPNAESTARRPQAQPGPRFQALNVQGDAATSTALETAVTPASDDVARLLPPGFSVEAAQSDAIAIAATTMPPISTAGCSTIDSKRSRLASSIRRPVSSGLGSGRSMAAEVSMAVEVPPTAGSGAAADRAEADPDAVDQAAVGATSYLAAAAGGGRVLIRDRSTTRSAGRSSTVRPINCARRFRSRSRSSHRTISARRSAVRSRSPASMPNTNRRTNFQ